MTKKSRMAVAAALLTLGVGGAAGQNLSKFVISDEAARKTFNKKNQISVETAEKITKACVNFAKKNNQAVTVFILSPTGQIVYSYRKWIVSSHQ